MLMADYVDLIPLHPLSLRYKLTEQELGDTELEKVLDLPVEGAYYMAYSLGTDPTLIKRTRQAFSKLQKDGTIESIRYRE